jgi:hypothetical protein
MEIATIERGTNTLPLAVSDVLTGITQSQDAAVLRKTSLLTAVLGDCDNIADIDGLERVFSASPLLGGMPV